jgi:fatty-acyl-CoA synthase
VRDCGLGSWPLRRARRTPDRTAIEHAGGALTYRQLSERVTRLAHVFADELGVRRGDRVAYLGGNHPSCLEALFAASSLGAVFVPLNTRLTAEEHSFMLADCGVSLLVAHPEHEQSIRAAGGAGVAVLTIGAELEAAVARASDETVADPVGLDEPCLLMYTSGTTGRPRAATLSHGNLVWNCYNVLVDMDLAADEVTLVTAPLFHVAALNMTCLPTLLKGGRVLLESRFDPERVLDLIEHERVTYVFGVPAMYAAIAASPRWSSADLTSLRILLCGGAPVPDALTRTYLDRGLSFIQGYGLTEAAAGVLCLDQAMSHHKAGSAGVPHFFTDVRVVGPGLEDVGPGERGEVLVGGPNVARGYWGRPATSQESFTADGWLRTGDVAVIDRDGYAFIVDRVKDMYISGGENVSPAEVENAIQTHPAVAECAVVGVPDPVWGEVGRALVVLRPGSACDASEILGHVAARLGRYKVPRTVEIVRSLPRNAAGKVLKAEMRSVPRPEASPGRADGDRLRPVGT